MERIVACPMVSPNGFHAKIAIASSGLGHIFRGVEVWADSLAQALHRRGYNVTLFQGAGSSDQEWRKIVNCSRRHTPGVERWAQRFSRIGGWRYGVGSGYEIEQTDFTLKMLPHIYATYDIVHTQDFWIALILNKLKRARLIRPNVILAHGTEEPYKELARVRYLQHLTPCQMDDYLPSRPEHQVNFAFGNFVRTDLFCPGDQAAARAAWDLPQYHLIVLCSAAIKKHHKRVHFLIEEFARFLEVAQLPATLVVAGGREAETDEVMALGRARLGDHVRFLEGIPHAKMPLLYQAADVFALASLHEMMSIAILEALSSGLPAVVSDTPTHRWLTGEGGLLSDVSIEGSMAAQFVTLQDREVRRQFSRRARIQAETHFSEQVIVEKCVAMYETVLETGGRSGSVRRLHRR